MVGLDQKRQLRWETIDTLNINEFLLLHLMQFLELHEVQK